MEDFFFKGKKNSIKAALFYTLSFITVILNVAERIARCTQAEDSAAACQLRAGGRRLTF